jgi:hypothetical protein
MMALLRLSVKKSAASSNVLNGPWVCPANICLMFNLLILLSALRSQRLRVTQRQQTKKISLAQSLLKQLEGQLR